MQFSVYQPPQVVAGPVPVLTWLSGLTCTEETFMIKSGAQRVAAELGLMLVAPDTSPRGDGVPDDVDGAYDFGLGAGFYINATEEPWSRNYNMYDYVTAELPEILFSEFAGDQSRQGIFGHSMGGHGALTIGLRNPEVFASISAFAPICSPINCPWGQKALGNYLGTDTTQWSVSDATELARSLGEDRPKNPILVDQGLADQFLEKELNPQAINLPNRYEIDIILSRGIASLGVKKDKEVTRYNLIYTANYTLKNTASGKNEIAGKSKIVGGYDAVSSDFGTYSAEKDAERRIMTELAKEIKLKLIAFFLNRKKTNPQTRL